MSKEPQFPDHTFNLYPTNNNDPVFSAFGDDGDESDELYVKTKKIFLGAGKASTSYIQRKLGVGYARATKLMTCSKWEEKSDLLMALNHGK